MCASGLHMLVHGFYPMQDAKLLPNFLQPFFRELFKPFFFLLRIFLASVMDGLAAQAASYQSASLLHSV